MSARVRLKTIAVKTHCREDWDAMTGDAAVRHCASCRSNVHNLSAMSEAEVEALLATSDDICVRYYYRPDGTIVTSRCETSAARRAPSTLAAGVAATLTMSAAFVGLHAATNDGSEPVAATAEPLRVAMGLRLSVNKVSKGPRPVGKQKGRIRTDAPVASLTSGPHVARWTSTPHPWVRFAPLGALVALLALGRRAFRRSAEPR